MKNNLKGELAVMDSLDIKPNYAALGRKYGMDWRTVKKYHNGVVSPLHARCADRRGCGRSAGQQGGYDKGGHCLHSGAL